MQAACRYTHLSESSIKTVRFVRSFSEHAGADDHEKTSFSQLDSFLTSRQAFELCVGLARAEAKVKAAEKALGGMFVFSEDPAQKYQDLLGYSRDFTALLKDIKFEETMLNDIIQSYINQAFHAGSTTDKLAEINLRLQMQMYELSNKD
mgnify:CR=1 FL=1